MLNTLRKIVQEVNSAKDLKAALGIIVQRVKEAMGTQVCSVYLLDTETQRFVLMATEGLNKRSIGKVSMAPSEGLVGLVSVLGSGNSHVAFPGSYTNLTLPTTPYV